MSDLRALIEAVKPLEWTGDPRWPGTSWAKSVCGEYQISEEDEGLWSLRLGDSVVHFRSREDAEKGARIDYGTRVLAGLTDEAIAALRAKLAEGE